MQPPHSRSPARHDRAPRAHPRRRLRVAAREGLVRGDRPPRGRERLHPGAHRAPGRAAPGDLRRDQEPHPRDRPVGADPQPRLLVLRPLLRGEGVRRQLPGAGDRPRRLDPAAARRGLRAGPAGAAGRAAAARSRRARRGPRVLLPRRLEHQPRRHAARLLDRRGRRRALHHPGPRPRQPRAPARRDRGRDRRRHLGPGRRAPLLRDASTTRGVPTRCGGTPSGPTQADDELVHHEEDGRFYVGVGRSRSRPVHDRRVPARRSPRSTASSTPRRPSSASRCSAERREGLEYSLDHAVIGGEDVFLVLHNATGPDFEIGTAPVAPTAPEGWTPLVPHDPAVRLEDVDAFAGHLVVHQRSEGLTQLRILELGDARVARRLPGRVRPRGLHGRLGRQPHLRPAHRPARLHDDGGAVVGLRLRRPDPRADAAPPRAGARRLRPRRLRGAPALGHRRGRRAGADLDRVPPRGAARRPARCRPCSTGTAPTRRRIDPYFSVARLSLLDRGAAFAIAHVRGGGEMGRRWYDDGKLDHKQHTFSDFIACGRHLVETGWTTPETLVAEGASAGGLLVGAVANQAPELFGGILAGVPFVDNLTTMLDATPAAHGHRVRRVGQPGGRPRGLRLHRVLRAVRQRGGRRPTRRSWPRPRSTTPGCSTSSPPSGWPGSAPPR